MYLTAFILEFVLHLATNFSFGLAAETFKQQSMLMNEVVKGFHQAGCDFIVASSSPLHDLGELFGVEY